MLDNYYDVRENDIYILCDLLADNMKHCPVFVIISYTTKLNVTKTNPYLFFSVRMYLLLSHLSSLCSG